MKSKYFQLNSTAELKKLREKVDLPIDFFLFYTEHRQVPLIYSLKPKEVHGIGLGFDVNEKFYLIGSLLNDEEMSAEIMNNLQGTIFALGLLKFADSEYVEGGFYIGVSGRNSGKVFLYKNYIDWAGRDDIVLLADSFTAFLDKLKPVGITFSEEGTVHQYLLEIMDERGELIGLACTEKP